MAWRLRLTLVGLWRQMRLQGVSSLTPSRLSALVTIAAGEPLRIGELAAEMAVSGPTVSNIVDALEEQGPPDASTVEGPECSLSVFGVLRHIGASPVSGAAMTLADSAGRRVGVTRTDHMGLYRLPVVTGGAYVLVASAAGYEPVALVATGSLRGSVHALGHPFMEARLTLMNPGGQVVATGATDRDGRFAFGDLPPGEHTLIAAGYSPVAIPIDVSEGKPVQAHVTLDLG